MLLEFHDAEIGNSHSGSALNIERMEQAENWVIEMAKETRSIVKCVLRFYDGQEIRRWVRDNGQEAFREVYNFLTDVGEPEPKIPTEHVWRFQIAPPKLSGWKCAKCNVVAENSSVRERFDRESPACAGRCAN